MDDQTALHRSGRESRGLIVLLGTLLLWVFYRVIEARTLPLDGEVQLFLPSRAEGLALGPAAPVLHALGLIVVSLVSVWAIWRFALSSERAAARSSVVWLVGGIVWALSFLHVPYLSNDLFLYRALGLVQQQGANPYVVAPSQVLDASQIINVPFARETSAYGPLALLLFRFATYQQQALAQIWLLKGLLVLPAVLMAVLVYRKSDEDAHLAVLSYVLLSPLIALELLATGHLEGWLSAFLMFGLALLEKPGPARAALAGGFLGLAVCIKAPALACLGPFLGFLLPSTTGASAGTRRQFVEVASLISAMLATIVLLYVPFWDGWQILEGGLQQSEMVRRSLHFLVVQATGLSSAGAGLGVSGMAVATVAGFLACRWGTSIAIGTALTLCLQAVLGRTFFQPWSVCPLVFLAAWSMATESTKTTPGSGFTLRAALVRYLVPSFSISAIVGGYAPYILVSRPGVGTECLSIGLILLVPLVTLALAWHRHRPIIRRR